MPRLSLRTRNLHPSPVREMLNVASRPGVISFAGGLPAADSFADIALPAPPRTLLQYGPTEGEPELRARIAEDLAALGLDAPPDRVMILSGSQQGIDLVAKLAVDPGTPVAVESPAYLAALQVFRFFSAELRPFRRDAPFADRGAGPPALAYVTPTFQNPTGACWTAVERRSLAEACDANDVILFEDDPYRDLVYEPCERRPVCADVRRASWIYQGSFSKSIAPGLRLGFLAASSDLFPRLAQLKQAADLHTNRLAQWIVLQHLNDPARPARLERLAADYRDRRDAFHAAMRRHLGAAARWTAPPGGLFFWAELAPPIDIDGLHRRALDRGVLFTPGRHFLADAAPCRALRLNFTAVSPQTAERGLSVLGELLAEEAAGSAFVLDRAPET
ncbi:MAG TPA: PLP-dependent aminotransferase family protein [Caulobacteraceae bacterium]|nr:PLP-dependent aminotransferase family protein [Caulobacteraceae bacterium]